MSYVKMPTVCVPLPFAVGDKFKLPIKGYPTEIHWQSADTMAIHGEVEPRKILARQNQNGYACFGLSGDDADAW